MTEPIDVIRDDIAFMRALAQEGRRTPLIGGASLVAAGLIYAAAALVCWAMAVGLLVAPQTWYVWVWVVASAIYTVVLGVLIRRWRREAKPGATAAGNRAFRQAWSATGGAMLTIFVSTCVLAWRFHALIVFSIFPSVILAIYGAAWSISAAFSDRRWVKWVAAGCFLAAIVMPMLPDAGAIFLGFAACLLLLMAAPGLALLRQEPSAIV